MRANMYVEEKGRKGRIGVYERKRMKKGGIFYSMYQKAILLYVLKTSTTPNHENHSRCSSTR